MARAYTDVSTLFFIYKLFNYLKMFHSFFQPVLMIDAYFWTASCMDTLRFIFYKNMFEFKNGNVR